MNEITKNIEKNFNENKYREALSLAREFISLSENFLDDEIQLLEKVFKNLSSLEFDDRFNFLEKLAAQEKISLTFLDSTIKASSINQRYKLYPIAKKNFLKFGQLEKLENLFNELKKEYIKYHSFSPLLEEVKSLESYGLGNLLTKNEIIKIKYGLGDTEYFDTEFKDSISKRVSPIDIGTIDIQFTNNMWRKQRFVVKDKVLRSKSLSNTEEAKELLKGIYELLIVDEESKDSIKLLFEYCVKYSNNILAKECIEILISKFSENVDSLKDRESKITHIEREEYEDIDLGEDLFDTEIESNDVTINKLVQQINLLKQDNNLDGATKLLRELRELDEDHSLVRELEEKEHLETGSKVKRFKKSITEIEAELLQEIELFSSRPTVSCDQKDHMERVSKKYVELTDLSQLEQECDHLIYTFNSFEFYAVSIMLIDRILQNHEEEIEKELHLIYLKCETLRLSSNFYGALNIIEELLDEKPLTNNEKVSFLYLKGELLRSLGRKSDALKSYSKVFRLNKNFRMVVDRLKEIE
jgi:hypothetical protein